MDLSLTELDEHVNQIKGQNKGVTSLIEEIRQLKEALTKEDEQQVNKKQISPTRAHEAISETNERGA